MKKELSMLCEEMRRRHTQEEIKFIDMCLKTIVDCVRSSKSGILIGGNYSLFTHGDEPMYLHCTSKEPIKLYSEDGWTKIEDIANWADVALDMLEKEYAKIKKNKKKMKAKIVMHNKVGQTYMSGEFETEQEAIAHGENMIKKGLIESFELFQ